MQLPFHEGSTPEGSIALGGRVTTTWLSLGRLGGCMRALQLLAQRVQQAAHARVAAGGCLVAVEEGALFCEDEAGTVALGRELGRSEGDGDPAPVEEHLVGVEDPPGSDDVLVDGLVGVDTAVRERAMVAFPSADAEVELELSLGDAEPTRLGLGIGPGAERPLRRGRVAALDDDRGVLYGSFARRLPPFCGSSALSARYSPRRSRRVSQLARRALIHRSTGRSATGSMRQVRTRPTFSERTRPLPSSTCRCCTTAGSDIGSGSAGSLTEARPRPRRSTISLLLGSASAWNARSTGSRPARW